MQFLLSKGGRFYQVQGSHRFLDKQVFRFYLIFFYKFGLKNVAKFFKSVDIFFAIFSRNKWEKMSCHCWLDWLSILLCDLGSTFSAKNMNPKGIFLCLKIVNKHRKKFRFLMQPNPDQVKSETLSFLFAATIVAVKAEAIIFSPTSFACSKIASG